ncbi:MAG: DUF4221 family protein [Bacteroidales bacterium]
MKKVIYSILFLFINLSLFCQKQVGFKLDKEISLNLTNNLPDDIEAVKIFGYEGKWQNNQFYFQALNSKKNKIYEARASTSGELNWNIIDLLFPKEFKNRIPKQMKSYYADDNFFIYDYNTSFVFLFDTLGNLLLNKQLVKDNSYIPLNFSSGLPFYKSQAAFCTAYDTQVDSNYFKKGFGVIFNFKNINNPFLKKLNIQFPSNYQKGNTFGFPWFRLNWTAKYNLCCNFEANDTLFVYNSKGKFLFKKNAGSKTNPIFIKEDKQKRHLISYSMKYNYKSPAYLRMVFDPYRKLYYRLFKFPFQLDENSINAVSTKDFTWSLIILDKNLEVIGEEIFPTFRGITMPFQIIPTPEGVWISHYSLSDLKNKETLKLGLYKIIEK